MEPIIFLAKDINHQELTVASSNNDESRGEIYAEDNVWFLNNICYIFEDEEADTDLEKQYENVILVDTDAKGSVCKVEVVSEKYQLLSFEQQDGHDNSIMLNVMSKLEESSNTTDLNELMELYHQRNKHLRRLVDSIGLE